VDVTHDELNGREIMVDEGYCLLFVTGLLLDKMQ